MNIYAWGQTKESHVNVNALSCAASVTNPKAKRAREKYLWILWETAREEEEYFQEARILSRGILSWCKWPKSRK